MKWADIAKLEGLDARQRSLFNIVDQAVEASNQGGGQIAVFYAEAYVDDSGYVAGQRHVFCPKVAARILYPHAKGMDAVVEGESVFFTREEDALAMLRHTTREQRKIDIKLVGTEAR